MEIQIIFEMLLTSIGHKQVSSGSKCIWPRVQFFQSRCHLEEEADTQQRHPEIFRFCNRLCEKCPRVLQWSYKPADDPTENPRGWFQNYCCGLDEIVD